MKKFVFISILLVSSFGVFCQENHAFGLRGFIDTYHAVRVGEPHDFLASRSRLRAEVDKINGNSHFFVSINAIHNSVIPENTGIQFREAYMDYSGQGWGFKIGRQIIIWGKADGLKITDVISPMDLTEFLAQDYDDIRMPVNGIVFTKNGLSWELDLICVPLFESYIMPGPNNPWGFDVSEMGIIEDEAITPAFNLANMEYGGKLSFYLKGIDFDVSALNTWNKDPVYSYYTDSASILHRVPEHHRQGFVGFAFSKALNAFIIRGESAFYFDKKYTPQITYTEMGLLESNSINYLVGIDWYPGTEWSVTGQFSDELILDYSNSFARQRHTYITTLGISKKIVRSTLQLSSFAYFELNDGSIFSRTSADYALSDNIHLILGLDWFHGDKGVFGHYSDNSQINFKAKYSF